MKFSGTPSRRFQRSEFLLSMAFWILLSGERIEGEAKYRNSSIGTFGGVT
jgi:hypothetical protein